MAHELDFNQDGIARMFSVNTVPWHGLGRVLDDPPTVAEALKLAGLDWPVSLRKLFIEQPSLTAGTSFIPTKTGFAVVRDSDGAILGIVGDRYKPLQNADALNFFDPFVTSGAVSLETAGALKGGRKVWILARVKGAEADVVKGDTVKAYLLLSNSHDGSTTIQVCFTPIRVVCANTLRAADSQNNGILRIYHTKSAPDVLKAVGETIDFLTQSFAATVEQYQFLAHAPMARTDVEKYIKRVFAPTEDVNSDETAKRIVNEVTPLLFTGRGTDVPGVQGTVWGAYNAVTEYLNYLSGRTQDNRLNSLWFGPNGAVMTRALTIATDMAKTA